MKEIVTNKNFHLVRCGDCCGWEFDIICDSTKTQGIISISHCKDEDNYTVDGTSLEEGCPIGTTEYPSKLEDLIQYLTKNFSRIADEDPCFRFNQNNPYCPTCNDDTLTTFEEVENNVD